MFSLDYLVHAGAATFLIAYIVRDQLLLRGFIVIGTILYVLYYLLLPEPLWSALTWNSLFIVINCVMMFLIYKDRAKFSMSEQEEELYRLFYTLSPGEFRTLMKIGTWFHTEKEEQITTKGEVPERLFFILDGAVSVDRGQNSFNVGPGVFIGELAFLMKNPATADVCLTKSAKGVSWNVSELSRMLAARPQMRVAFDSLLNKDLASKLSKD